MRQTAAADISARRLIICAKQITSFQGEGSSLLLWKVTRKTQSLNDLGLASLWLFANRNLILTASAVMLLYPHLFQC